MEIPEIIAQLDTMERELDDFRLRLRTLRHDLFSTLDSDPGALVE